MGPPPPPPPATAYDYIVIGGGPTGLTLATHLPGKVALVERHEVLGGCHRSPGDATKPFVEHGPRVYSGAYVNVADILETIGLSWEEVYVATQFSPELIDGKRWYEHLSAREIAALSWDYCVYALFDADRGRDVTMRAYCRRHGFSAASERYVDSVCRFSDGGGADRYSLWEFLSGFDQHTRPFYVPRRPMNHVFEAWHAFLARRGVDVFLGSPVTRVTPTSVAMGDRRVVRARKVILAVPPKHADALLRASGIHEPGFRRFATLTKYDPYYSVSLFGAGLNNADGHATTDWGVIALQYPFGVVSAAATRFGVPSSVTGKTLAATRSPDAAAAEIKRQLGFGDGVSCAYEDDEGGGDSAFFAAVGAGYVPFELGCNISTVGCHNGRSSYHFTSMESAVQNALAYLGIDRREPAYYAADAVRILAPSLALAVLAAVSG